MVQAPAGEYEYIRYQHELMLFTGFRLIAIMLSRLRMGVDDCIDAYKNFGGRVFGNPRHFHSLSLPLLTTRTKYDPEMLKNVISNVVKRYDRVDGDGRHTFESEPQVCQTYV